MMTMMINIIVTKNIPVWSLQCSSREHAYIILTSLNPIFYSKTGVYRGTFYFSYFCSKHGLRVLVRTASSKRF